jgi:cytochrome c-type biogenesis protein CcmH/NrfF
VKGNTLLLWVAPMLLLAGGALFVGMNVKRRRGLLDEEDLLEQERLAQGTTPDDGTQNRGSGS